MEFKIFKVTKMVVVIALLASCAIIPKNAHEQIETMENGASLVPIVYSWKLDAGNPNSTNVDQLDSANSKEPFFQPEISDSGFKITDSDLADYNVQLYVNAMSAGYKPRKDVPFLYIPRYTWLTLSILSLGLIPYHTYVEQNFVLSVENVKTKVQKKYEINGNYDLWVSIFLIHKAKIANISKIRQEYGALLVKELLVRFKNDIKDNRI